MGRADPIARAAEKRQGRQQPAASHQRVENDNDDGPAGEMRESDGRTERDANQGRDADRAHAHNQRQPDDRKQPGVTGQQELKRRDGWFHAAYLAQTSRKWSISEEQSSICRLIHMMELLTIDEAARAFGCPARGLMGL
jgi:hypothetical protein